MDAQLEKLVRKVAILAQQKFSIEYGIHPYFYGEREGKKRIIFDPMSMGVLPEGEELNSTTKAAIVGSAEMIFAMYKVDRYVYVAEAWMLATEFGATKEEIKEGMKIGARNSPKRVEVIHYEAEDMDKHAISGHQSIIRPAGGVPYLDDDLTLHDTSEWESTGRFSHLLEFRKFVEARSK
jgi:hypothetical protein